jgi:phosphoribosylformimino-5-aminoimidazole carboxamide ribotide isomerase
MIPAIDLIDGSVVRLSQGDYARQTTYSADPLTRLKQYEADGAALLHLVDLTGAKDPTKRQLSLLQHLIENLNAQVQVGGGIRSEADVQSLLNIGAARVVVGSMAVKQPEEVSAWFRKFGSDKIVLALDVRVNDKQQAMVATHGWQEDSDVTIEEVIERYLSCDVQHILCTDIARDGMGVGANVALYQSLTRAYPQLQFQASGGIGSLNDIAALKPTGVAGVIVGRALLEGKFTVKEALQCWQSESSPA